MRVIAILAVITIHTTPFALPSPLLPKTVDLGVVLDQISRFAVPCLFALSGYFWAAKFDSDEAVWASSWRMMKRITMLFIVWTLFYFLVDNTAAALEHGGIRTLKQLYWRTLELNGTWLLIIMEGSKGHLWFLSSLVSCVAISALFLSRGWRNSLLLLAVVLYVIGLLGGAYKASPIGFQASFNFRDGPFLGLIFFVTGYWLKQLGPRQAWFPAGVLLLVLGTCVHLLEIVVLNDQYATLAIQDFVLGTLLSGTGAALIALSGHSSLEASALARTGPFVLGIYALHYCVIDALAPLALRLHGNVVWEIAHPFVVFIVSVMAVRTLAGHRPTRPLVM